jgi:hypothetical protein
MRALVATALLIIACTSSPTNAPSGKPSPAKTEPVVSQDECRTIASLRNTRCGDNEARAYAQCDSYVDLVAKTGCSREARASYDCSLAVVKACNTKECCTSSITACDAIDLKFTNCTDAYCKTHKQASECGYVPQ